MLHCGIAISKRSRSIGLPVAPAACFSCFIASYTKTISLSLHQVKTAHHCTKISAREASRLVLQLRASPYSQRRGIITASPHLAQRFSHLWTSSINTFVYHAHIQEARSSYWQQQRWITSKPANAVYATDKATSKLLPVKSQKSLYLQRLYRPVCPKQPVLSFRKSWGLSKTTKPRRYASRQQLMDPVRHQAMDGYYSDALNSIENIVRGGEDVNNRRLLRACALLLRQAARHSISISADILVRLLRLNVRPDIVMHNTLIAEASKSNDPILAWEIYNLIRANGIDPSEYTYTILLKMCRKTNDSQAYEQLRVHLQPDDLDGMGPALVTEVLCCRHFFGNRYNFDPMLRFYERFCDLQPLKTLGMISTNHQSRYAGSHPLPRAQATASTLNIMLVAFLRSCNGPEKILSTYRKFQESVKLGDPLIVPLLANEYTYNIFMKAISAYPTKFGILRPNPPDGPPQLEWRNILRTLSTAPNPNIINCETGKPMRQLRPTEVSWNIILTAYARSESIPETEAIFELMKMNGMKPMAVTWDGLLSGFSRRQRLDHVANLLVRMEASGIPATDYTARALSHVKDRRQLLDLVQEARGTERAKAIAPPNLEVVDSSSKDVSKT